MTWLGSRLSRGAGRIALGVFATAAAAVLLAPTAVASPESDAANAVAKPAPVPVAMPGTRDTRVTKATRVMLGIAAVRP